MKNMSKQKKRKDETYVKLMEMMQTTKEKWYPKIEKF
jgi:hypothetical protein